MCTCDLFAHINMINILTTNTLLNIKLVRSEIHLKIRPVSEVSTTSFSLIASCSKSWTIVRYRKMYVVQFVE